MDLKSLGSEDIRKEIKAIFGPVERDVQTKTKPRSELNLHETDQVAKVLNFADEQDVIGTPGTMIRDGKIRVEQTYDARPYKLRGRRSRPGLLEDFYRSEPVMRDSVDSTVEVQMGASRKLVGPSEDKLPDDISPEEMAEWVERCEGYFRAIEGGLRDGYVFDAIQSTALFGFAPFEVVWATSDDEPVPFPVKLAYRETATVEEFVFNERMDTLVAAEFKTGGDDDREYTLTAVGEDLTDRRLVIANVAARGNNVEGVAPGRASLHWVRFKRLLSQIQAAAAQVYGMPSRNLTVDPELLVADFKEFWQATDVDVEQAIDDYDKTDAVEAVVNYLPPPLKVEMADAAGEVPNFENMIRYCDEMIARPFSNEGSLLGHEQVGSYALAEVADNKFLRSAAPYHRAIMGPIQQLTTLMTRLRFEKPRLLAIPTWEFQLPGRESTELITAITNAMGKKPATQWPPELQRVLTDFLGIEPDALAQDETVADVQGDQDGDPDDDPEPPEPPQDGPPQSDGDDEGDGADPTTPGGEAELQETRTAADIGPRMAMAFQEFESRAPELESRMNDAEERLGEEWADIAERQRQDFRDATDGVADTAEIRTAADRMVDRYARDYREAAREQSERLQREGVITTLREIGKDAPDVESIRAPTLPPTIRAMVDGTIEQAASQANRRNVENMVDQRIEQMTEAARGGRQGSVSSLAKGTMVGIAGSIAGRSLNAGRTGVVQQGLALYERQTGNEQAGARSATRAQGANTRRGERSVEVVRTSMLDKDVCDNCWNLDFEKGGPTYVMGSSAYYSAMPPKPCLGGLSCRCSYIHSVPEPQADAVAEYVDASLVI